MPRMMYPNPHAGLGETVLLVEEDLESRRLTSFYLNDLGYHTLEATGAAEAVALAHEHGSTIRLLLTDLAMASSSGVDLAQQIRSGQPGLPVVFLAGRLSAPDGDSKQTRFLRKPFTKTELAIVVRETLDAADGVVATVSSVLPKSS